MKRGHKPGRYHPAYKPGGMRAWLQAAKSGDVYWIEGRKAASVAGDALKFNRDVTTRTYYALHPATHEVVELVRIQIKPIEVNP